MKKNRGFEVVSETNRKDTSNVILPIRGTKFSAGYDFSTPTEIIVPAHGKTLIWTNVKAYMQEGEFLSLHIRSSIGIKKGLRLANITGIIDMDYYNNESNEGNIGICLVNDTDNDVALLEGERIAQGIFTLFLVSDNCNSEDERQGGIGSTNQK